MVMVWLEGGKGSLCPPPPPRPPPLTSPKLPHLDPPHRPSQPTPPLRPSNPPPPPSPLPAPPPCPPPWGPSAHFYWGGGGVAYKSEETSPPCMVAMGCCTKPAIVHSAHVLQKLYFFQFLILFVIHTTHLKKKKFTTRIYRKKTLHNL